MLYRIIFTLLLVLISTPSFSQWNQVGTRIDGEAAGDNAGYDVSLNEGGNIMAISAPYNDDVTYSSGHVRIFEFNGTDWVQLGSDIDGQSIGEKFGYKAKLSGDGHTIAISSPNKSNTNSHVGYVKIYTFNGTDWIQVGNSIFGVESYADFGSTLSINAGGTIVAVGSQNYDGSSSNIGQVKVYAYDGTNWNQLGTSINGSNSGDRLGCSVTLNDDGTILALGAVENDDNGNNAGQVQVFQYDSLGLEWNQIGDNLDGNSSNDNYGYKVSLSSSGDTLAVSSFRANVGLTGTGEIYVYHYDGVLWSQIGNTIGEVNDVHLGLSLSINGQGNRLIVGAHSEADNNENKGHSRVYQLNGSLWEQVGNTIEGVDSLDHSGWAVHMSKDGSTIAIGAILDDDNGIDAGSVHVFNTSNFISASNFIFNELDTCEGIFEFTDSSTNSPMSWYWNFGDRDTSTMQNPTHQYITSGIFNVELIVGNSFGFDTITQTLESQIIDGEIVVISPLSIGSPIDFQCTSSNIINYHWNFGDGDTSILASPSHVYLNALEYNVSLSIENTIGCTTTIDTIVDLTPFLGLDLFSQDVHITPNPSTGNVQIVNESINPIAGIILYNTLGKPIFNKSYKNKQAQINLNLSEVENGIYLVYIKYENGQSHSEMLVIQH